MISPCLILRPEFVKEHNVNCEKCGRPAYASLYDEESEAHEYCQECYPAD